MSSSVKVALLCSGLGNVNRGHEVFARGLFEMVRGTVDMTLFKGGGEPADHEIVLDHVPRDSPLLDDVHLAVAPKWEKAAAEVERMRIEGETFAYAALKPLLAGGFDVIHCLEQEVCNVLYAHRHVFSKTPRFVFSNGGAIPASDLPSCDFVQEHSPHNLAQSALSKAFVIPHGVDTSRFHPGVQSDFRRQHGIPDDAFVVISVGTVCYWHKRMDYVIREVAQLDNAYLLIVGQPSRDSPEIEALGRQLMGDRIVFASLPHAELPQAYAAADVFVLGSLFETFGIVYIEAMAMGLPVVSTNHPNQQAIVQQGLFIDMKREGALTTALRQTPPAEWKRLGQRGREIALRDYDLNGLKRQYIERYRSIASAALELPRYTLKKRIFANVRNAAQQFARAVA